MNTKNNEIYRKMNHIRSLNTSFDMNGDLYNILYYMNDIIEYLFKKVVELDKNNHSSKETPVKEHTKNEVCDFIEIVNDIASRLETYGLVKENNFFRLRSALSNILSGYLGDQ